VLHRLADLAVRRPRRILLATVVFVVLAGAAGGPVANVLSASDRDFEDHGSESVIAAAQLTRAASASPDVDVVAIVPDHAEAVQRVRTRLAGDPAVARIFDGPVARDGRTTYVAVSLRPVPLVDQQAVGRRIEALAAQEPGVTLGGPLIAGIQASAQVKRDLARAEALAFPLLFLLSLLIFRGLVAALLPLAVGMVSIIGTFAALTAVNQVTTLSVFALNLVTGLGLGLAIDYSLLIVGRYREELARVAPGPEALLRTVRSSGRTVLFSGLTVAAASASLLVFPQRFLYSMGVGAVLVALISAATALLVLPAILAVLGPRVNALAPARLRRSAEQSARPAHSGLWYRWSALVMRHARLVAVASAVALVALGLPFLGIKFTGFDGRLLPQSASARQAADALATDFARDDTAPIYIAAEARAGDPHLREYARELRGLPGAAAVRGPLRAGNGVSRVDVIPREPPLDASTQRLVEQIRAVDAGVPTRVGGQAARWQDQQASLSGHLPRALAILATTTFLLLLVMTGSILLPLKALIMNLLTISATFGILVAVFQDGRLEQLLGYSSLGALDSTQPILLAVVAFALSTDYGIFLLTRIKEAREQGADVTESVAIGLERTGRTITAAALLFSVAVGAFATSEIVFIKELGLGMALAVMIDATLVRALLVPSLMKLLGRWNWWAPRPLRRLHDRSGPRAQEA